MRFVAMKLRNTKSVSSFSDDENSYSNSDSAPSSEEKNSEDEDDSESNGNDSAFESVSDTWQPSMEGFVKHLVDCELMFETLERIVEESNDVAYAYFRKTGLERSEDLAKDIEWFKEREVEIPELSNPGVSYAKYLEELSKDSAPLFLTHFYNVYFLHVAGGQVIVKQVKELSNHFSPYVTRWKVEALITFEEDLSQASSGFRPISIHLQWKMLELYFLLTMDCITKRTRMV